MDRRGSLEENGHERARSTEYVEWGVHAGQRNPAALARGDGTGRAGARTA
jgi:hypothetical protein